MPAYTAVTTDAQMAAGGGWMRASTRQAHRARTNDACGLCGKATANGHIGHMVPRCRGGKNDPTNTLYICRSCNARMGSMTLDEYCASRPRSGHKLLARAKAFLAQPLDRAEGRRRADVPKETVKKVNRWLSTY